jgi:transcriptional regulator with PAS, ATPase and Fis domain
MSSTRKWGGEGLSSLKGAQASIVLREAALDQQLDALREAALKVLTDVEALGNIQTPHGDRGLRLGEEVKQFEIDLIRIALDRTSGNQTQAAKLLGVKLTTLNTKIKISFPRHQMASDEVADRQNAA